jgi:hypothetical protein
MEPETAWRAGVLHHLPEAPGFRVARPVPATDGSWAAHGWEAWRLVGGSTDPHRADEVIRAGEAFHAALAHLPRPRFLRVRDTPWSRADRLAWQETEQAPDFPLLKPLLAERGTVDALAQVVHGDLLGNVLFEPGRPPAITDCRPTGVPRPTPPRSSPSTRCAGTRPIPRCSTGGRTRPTGVNCSSAP